MPKGYKTRVCANVKCAHHGKDQPIAARLTHCECGAQLQEPPK